MSTVETTTRGTPAPLAETLGTAPVLEGDVRSTQAVSRRPRPVRAAFRLLGSEVSLTLRRPRNLVLIALAASVPVILGIVLRLVGGDDDAPAIVLQIGGNGLMLTFASMLMLVQLLLPLTVAVVAGDAVAGEASLGTLRYLLTAPAGRTRLLLLKFANVTIYALVCCAVVAVVALIVGVALFPVGPVQLLSGATVSVAEGLLRVAMVVGYVTLGMAAFGAVGIAVSTFTDVPIGAVAVSVVAMVFSQVIMLVPQLEPVRPYLLTTWWNSFDGVLRDPIAADVLGQGLLVFAAYTFVFGAIAWSRFTGRDITT
ncbi:ABC transporter permease subunit [Sphaerisporangium sp. B11E5]|uniref:ABC transporter permease subunit n=1 Tax=Sphaerisporangium sp. B11E5 TaxID=3153563 RepID=UPI00325C4080